MSLIPYNATITVKRYARNRWGQVDEENSSTHKIRCRLESTTRMIRNDRGEDTQGSYIMLMGKKADIRPDDKVIRPGDTREYGILEIFDAAAFGPHHKEVVI